VTPDASDDRIRVEGVAYDGGGAPIVEIGRAHV